MAEVFNMELRDGADEEEISDEEYPTAESNPQVSRGDNLFQLVLIMSYANWKILRTDLCTMILQLPFRFNDTMLSLFCVFVLDNR